MSRNKLFAIVAVFLCWASSVRAQSRPASVLENVRLQMLPSDIHNVYAGPDGRIWLSTSDVADVRWRDADAGIDDVKKCIEGEFGKAEPRIPDSISLVLFEPQGRVWFKCATGGSQNETLLGFDGKQWISKTLGPTEHFGWTGGKPVARETRPEVNVESFTKQSAAAAQGAVFFICETEGDPSDYSILCFDGDGWRRQEIGHAAGPFFSRDGLASNLIVGPWDDARIWRLENLAYRQVNGDARLFTSSYVVFSSADEPWRANVLARAADRTVFSSVGNDILAYRPAAPDNRLAISCEQINTTSAIDGGGDLFGLDVQNRGVRRFDGKNWVHVANSLGDVKLIRAGDAGYALASPPMQLLTPEGSISAADLETLIKDHPTETAMALRSPAVVREKPWGEAEADGDGNIWTAIPSVGDAELGVFLQGNWTSARDVLGAAVDARDAPNKASLNMMKAGFIHPRLEVRDGVVRAQVARYGGPGTAPWFALRATGGSISATRVAAVVEKPWIGTETEIDGLKVRGALLPPVMCEGGGVKRVFAVTVLGLQEFVVGEKGEYRAKRTFAVNAFTNGLKSLEWSSKGFLVLTAAEEERVHIYIFKLD